MSSRSASVAIAATAIFATTSQTVAGGYSASCYEQIRQPAVYKTIHEQVMVSPSGKHVEIIPAIYGTVERAVVVRPASVSWHVVPAQYAWHKEKVLIEPARKIARVIPAVTKTVHRQVMVSEGGWGWEWQVIKGRKVLCKVKRPPVYRTVAETVVVHPEQVIYDVVPAQYGYEKRQVLIAPERKEKVVIPAEYGFVAEQVVVRPAQKRVHHTPPVYRTVSRQVLVQGEHTSWRPVRDYCKGRY
jgi:hypothetical protein